MTDGQDSPRTLSTAIPAIPLPTDLPPPGRPEEDAKRRIATLEREARALGSDPRAALLFHEVGLLWESPLKHPRNAAVAYQAAYKLSPRFLANIRAARRLFSEVGNWMMVLQLIEAELQASDSPRARATLLFEKAQILEQRLSREAEAMAGYAECLAQHPQDVSLLAQLEQIFAERADHPQVVAVQRLLAEVVSDDGARAHYLTAAGLLLEDRIKDFTGAAQCFRAAFKLDRRDPLLLAAIKRLAQREGTVEEELAALAAEAEAQGAMAAPTFLQISKVYERLGRPEDALAALVAARRVAPTDPLILSELSRIYETQGRHEELADALLAWVGNITDASEAVSINLRLAALYEEQLKRDADAIGRFRAILDKSKGHPTALAGLGKLYHRAQNWQGLLETFDAEIAALDDPRQKAGRTYKSAEILEERLGRTDEAISRYNQCLQLQPGYLPAQKALIRLYEKLGRFHELITMFEQDLLQATDVEQQVTTLHRIAGIYEERLEDLPHAIDSLKRVLELAPQHLGTVRNLARIYEAADQWKELIELHEQETTLTGDTKNVISLVHRIAEILEEQLRDRPGAIAAYERVLQLAPAYLPALKALGRLYGQTAQWEPLIRMFKVEAEITPSTDEAASLTHRIGELYEHKLKLENEAITSYQEVLTLAPTYFPALRALARIYRAQGAWESLIEVLRSEAANRTDPHERANAMFQAASIWEDQLKKPQNAIEGYQEVLRLSPTHPSALQQLERLLTQSDALQELILVLDRQTQAGTSGMKLAASLKLARLYLDRLNEPARAASCCEAALAVDPDNLSALKLLERIRSGDKAQRNALRARLAQTLGDTKLSAALNLAAAESGVDATGRTSAEVLAKLKSAWQEDPGDASLGSMLERALQRSGDAAGLAALYAQRLSGPLELSDQVQLNLRLGELHEGPLREPTRAAQAYGRALALQPGLLPALRGLSRAEAMAGNLLQAREAIEQLAAAAVDPQTATDALLEAARLARAAGDSVAASALFGKVLEKSPLHPEAGAGLEELLAERGGSRELALMHERRGEARLAAQDAPAAAAEFLRAARVCLEQLKDKPRAIGLLGKVLLAEPANVEALELKGDLALESQDYAEAAAAFAVRVQQGGASKHLSALHLKLGALYQDHVGDPTRAAAHLGTVLASEPQNVEALQRLAAIHTASKNWTGAADCLRQLLELVTSPQDRARHTLALARIVDEGFADAAQASTLYKKALELAPGDSATLDRLGALYERTGSLQELVVVLEQQAGIAPDLKRMVALKLRVADLHARSLGNVPKAIATYKAVLENDPANLAAHVALAELYTKDPGLPSMAIEAHRALLKLEPSRLDSLHTLFRLWEGLRQYDKAFCVAGVLTFLRAQTEMEGAFYTEGKNRIPQLASQLLTPADLLALHHPWARNALVDVLRAIGDQLTKVHPPNLEALGIDRRADRLKADHAVSKAVRAVASLVGAEEYEVYQAKRGWVTLETTEPLGVCVGQDLVRRTNAEQRFLLGRAALGLVDKAAVLRKVSSGEAADLFGNSVRIHKPDYAALGRRNDDASKALRRAYSRRALKQLEEPADAVAQQPTLNLDTTIEGLALSADRAGLLFCGDVAAGLSLMLKEELPAGASRVETPESVAAQVASRRDLREVLGFAVSDDLFRLRQRLQLSLG